MIVFKKRISSFIELGNVLRNLQQASSTQNDSKAIDHLKAVIPSLKHHNGWFIEKEVHRALGAWGNLLTEKNINEWLLPYSIDTKVSKTVGLIMAGNIPLVGLHDLLCVLICGHRALIKLSSNDAILLPLLCDVLIEIEPSFEDYITFTDSKLENFDAAIATGSNNSARYFHHYFDAYPNIIRSNRNSVAVLSGNESEEDLKALGSDIFDYFGLGCRSVSKLYVPENYNFDLFFNAIFSFSNIINYSKYANNYDYNKAVYLMSEFKLLDNGFIILKEDKQLCSPLATVFYEHYSDVDSVTNTLASNQNAIQCIVSKDKTLSAISFGKAQSPKLNDYADQEDTVQFLLGI